MRGTYLERKCPTHISVLYQKARPPRPLEQRQGPQLPVLVRVSSCDSFLVNTFSDKSLRLSVPYHLRQNSGQCHSCSQTPQVSCNFKKLIY